VCGARSRRGDGAGWMRPVTETPVVREELRGFGGGLTDTLAPVYRPAKGKASKISTESTEIHIVVN